MKVFKRIVLALAIILTIPLIVAIFTKKEYSVVREVTINKPRQDVFNYIKLLKNQANYSKWVMEDPNARMTYTGTDGTVGFVSAWDSDNKNVGKGSQTISNIVDGQKMDLDLHFIKPMEGVAQAYMATEDAGAGQTKVKWGFNGRMSYPLNFMLVVMDMDKMLGKDLAAGLANLKTVLEK